MSIKNIFTKNKKKKQIIIKRYFFSVLCSVFFLIKMPFQFLSGPLLSQCGRSSVKRDPYTKMFQSVLERSSIDSRTLTQLKISYFKKVSYIFKTLCAN